MTKSKIRLVCIKLSGFLLIALVLVLRASFVKPPLPRSWQAGDAVAVTLRLVQPPVFEDSVTRVAQDTWNITILGYHPLELGHRYTFVGEVTPHYLWNKLDRVSLRADSVAPAESRPVRLSEQIAILLARLRTQLVSIFDRSLPTPLSHLASGILLGVTGQMPRSFRDDLATTGTMHIVAASGYNVTVVAQAVLAVLVPLAGKRVALGGSVFLILCYVLLAGASPAVVRAGIMGSLTLLAFYWGRPPVAKRLLWVAAFLMLFIDPLLIGNVGFQLSLAATAGLLYIEPLIARWGDRLVGASRLQAFLSEYLYPTLAATLATLPIIAWTFGRVSWIAPLVNMAVLPAVPLAMLTSFIALVSSPMPWIGPVALAAAYVPLWYMVRVIELVGSFV